MIQKSNNAMRYLNKEKKPSDKPKSLVINDNSQDKDKKNRRTDFKRKMHHLKRQNWHR